MTRTKHNIYKTLFHYVIMSRLRKIKKYGNSHVIILHVSDMNDLDLKKGDIVDIDDLVKVKKRSKK